MVSLDAQPTALRFTFTLDLTKPFLPRNIKPLPRKVKQSGTQRRHSSFVGSVLTGRGTTAGTPTANSNDNNHWHLPTREIPLRGAEDYTAGCERYVNPLCSPQLNNSVLIVIALGKEGSG
jgi:hypothetical protein